MQSVGLEEKTAPKYFTSKHPTSGFYQLEGIENYFHVHIGNYRDNETAQKIAFKIDNLAIKLGGRNNMHGGSDVDYTFENIDNARIFAKAINIYFGKEICRDRITPEQEARYRTYEKINKFISQNPEFEEKILQLKIGAKVEKGKLTIPSIRGENFYYVDRRRDEVLAKILKEMEKFTANKETGNASTENRKNEFNPFVEENPVPVDKQSEPYKKAYNEIQNAWNDYKNGELNVLEFRHNLENISLSDNMSNDEKSSLSNIREKIYREIYSEKNAEKLADAYFQMWLDNIRKLKEYSSIKKSVDLLVSQKNESKISSTEALEKIKSLYYKVTENHQEDKTFDAKDIETERTKWIKEKSFKYDDSKSVEENIQRAEKLAQEYLDKFGITTNINNHERISLRRQIIEELYGNGAQKKERKAFLVMGLPASGKSTIAETVAKDNGALIIDSDMAKEKLPEFNGGLLATAVHDESTLIANRILDSALLHGDNVVLPVVGSYEIDLQEKIQLLKSEGYEVNLYHVALTIEKALERAQNRFKETGRLVSTTYIKSVGLKPKENYDKLKTNEGVDSYAEWSNDVDRGQGPRLLERSTAQLQTEGGLELRRTQYASGLDERNGTLEESTTENQEKQTKSDELTQNQSSKEISPFVGEKILIPKHNQSSKQYFQAFHDLEMDWHGYKNGKIDIEELLKKADKILRQFQESFSTDEISQQYLKEYDSLWAILKNFEDENASEEVQVAKKKAWEDFQKLQDTFKNLQKSGMISEKDAERIEKEIYKIINQIQKKKYSAIKGYNELRNLLFGVMDIGTPSLEFDSSHDEQAMINAILNAPVGTKINADSGFGNYGKSYYEISTGGNSKTIASIDEEGRRSNYLPLKLNRANVKKLFGQTKFGSKSVTLTLPENLLKYLPSVEQTVNEKNDEGVVTNESEQLGESGSVNGRHQDVESELRETADEETRQEGRDNVSEKLSGQKRQDAGESGKNLAETNAENPRPPEAKLILFMIMKKLNIILHIRYYLRQLWQKEPIREEWKWNPFLVISAITFFVLKIFFPIAFLLQMV